MLKFLKKILSKAKRLLMPRVGMKNVEVELKVRRKDGTLKSWRKLRNGKVIEDVDV